MKNVWAPDELTRFLCERALRSRSKAKSLLLSSLYMWCVCANSWLLRHLEALSSSKTPCRKPAFRFQDTWVDGTVFKRETHSWKWNRASAQKNYEETSGETLQRLCFFFEALIVQELCAADPQLPILSKISSLLEVSHLGGGYELVGQLCTQFSLKITCINFEICWSRNEVLVSIRICSGKLSIGFGGIQFCSKIRFDCFFCFQSKLLNVKFPRIFLRFVGWAKHVASSALCFKKALTTFLTSSGRGTGTLSGE